MNIEGQSEMTLAVAGIGTCGTGFDSAAHLAQQLSIPIADGVPAAPPTESTLESWAIASARAALRTAQKQQIIAAERIGLLYVSMWGSINQTVAYLESMLAEGGIYASPRLFTRSVYSAVASQTSIELGIRGGCETLAFVNLPVCRVLQRAWCLLASGRLDAVIALWADQVEEPAIHFCQRAAAELHHPKLARYAQPGGGSVALALASPTAFNGLVHLTLAKNLDGAAGKLRRTPATMQSQSVDQSRSSLPSILPSIPPYPTDGALGLARELMWCQALHDHRVWHERELPCQANIYLQAAKPDR